MAVTPKNLAAASVGTSSTTLYTAPANTTTVIKAGSAHNTAAVADVLTVSLNPGGGGALVVLLLPLAASDAESMPELVNHVLEAGGTVEAVAASGTVNVVLSGLEYV